MREHYSELNWWALNPITTVLIRKGESQRREDHMNMETGIGVRLPQAKEYQRHCQQPLEAGRGEEELSLRASGESVVLLTP